jgi:hypothetical protein
MLGPRSHDPSWTDRTQVLMRLGFISATALVCRATFACFG